MITEQPIILGINASRSRSGGAINHLRGILTEVEPEEFGTKEVHLWAHRGLLDMIPERNWLIKHNPKESDKGLLSQILWEKFELKRELKRTGCSILFNTDAGSFSRFSPSITMSQDMLEWEIRELKRFGFSKAALRLWMLRYINKSSFKHSDGIIFLTQYAAEVIQKYCGRFNNIAIIPHGVGHEFKLQTPVSRLSTNNNRSFSCLYVSNVALYKHQWNVVRAISVLRTIGYDVELHLAGGGPGSGASKAERMLKKEIESSNPDGNYIKRLGLISHGDLPKLISMYDLFIFASSCENMPNTLLEGMAVGLPIASSDRGPMPEILQDGGVYFNPEETTSIADAIESLLIDKSLRERLGMRAKELSQKYSWKRCADETFKFIAATYRGLPK